MRNRAAGHWTSHGAISFSTTRRPPPIPAAGVSPRLPAAGLRLWNNGLISDVTFPTTLHRRISGRLIVMTEASSAKKQPYEARHAPLVPCFEFEESGNGVRYYQYPTEGPDKNREIFDTNMREQKYFYRAMLESEAEGWKAISDLPVELRLKKYLTDTRLKIDGHQGWASYRGYSEKYLKNRANDYTFILEVFAPEFVNQLMEIGVKSGKAEDGDISWGMGKKNSNSFGGDKKMNDVLKTRFEEFSRLVSAAEQGSIGKFESNNMRQMSVIITPFIFLQTIRWVKKIDLRSVPTDKKK